MKWNLIKNGQRNYKAFFQWRPPNGQQAHEKVFNVTHHHGNVNQNHAGLSPHPSRVAFIERTRDSQCWWGHRAGEAVCTAVGNVNLCSHYGEYMDGSPKKLKIEQPFGYMCKGNENTLPKRHAHSRVHCSIIHNSWAMEDLSCLSSACEQTNA